MLKKFLLPILAVSASLLTGCAAALPMAWGGAIYRDVKMPQAVTSNALGPKVGTAQAISILGLINVGDASTATAALSAGITQISSVDYESMQILGIYSTYTVIVHGN